jgi:hypothetical protein
MAGFDERNTGNREGSILEEKQGAKCPRSLLRLFCFMNRCVNLREAA